LPGFPELAVVGASVFPVAERMRVAEKAGPLAAPLRHSRA
jgi:hypothetical protein